eukprot:scaffold2059_cov106-Isochrysis_galbana.AAC.5
MCWARLRFPEGLRSARSMAAGLFAASAVKRSHQADAVCRLAGRLQQAAAARFALATEAAGLRALALARRGCKAPEAIRMLW